MRVNFYRLLPNFLAAVLLTAAMGSRALAQVPSVGPSHCVGGCGGSSLPPTYSLPPPPAPPPLPPGYFNHGGGGEDSQTYYQAPRGNPRAARIAASHRRGVSINDHANTLPNAPKRLTAKLPYI